MLTLSPRYFSVVFTLCEFIVHPTINPDSPILEPDTKPNILTQLSYVVVQRGLLPLFWCCNTCMAIHVRVQYNGGFLPDIILLTRCYYLRQTQLYPMKSFLSLQPMFPPKRFDMFFSPARVDAQNHRGLDAFMFFYRHRQLGYRK